MIYVMCYGGQIHDEALGDEIVTCEQIVEQHQPLWQAHGQRILYVCPTANPIKLNVQCECIGENCKVGRGTAQRLQRILQLISLDTSGDPSIIFEYDSFCTNPNFVPLNPGLHGITSFHPMRHIMVTTYAQAPWVLNSHTAGLIYDQSVKWFNLGDWNADRVLSGWAQLACVPLISLGVHSYGVNTFYPQDIDHFQTAFQLNPPVWIHGVKNKLAFDYIMQYAQGAVL